MSRDTINRFVLYKDDEKVISTSDPKMYVDDIPMYARIFMGLSVLPNVSERLRSRRLETLP